MRVRVRERERERVCDEAGFAAAMAPEPRGSVGTVEEPGWDLS